MKMLAVKCNETHQRVMSILADEDRSTRRRTDAVGNRGGKAKAMKLIPALALGLILAAVPASSSSKASTKAAGKTPATPAAANETCLACHGDKTMKSESGKSLFVDAAKHSASVHGELGCTTCHADIKDFPHPTKVAKVTCATCHDDEAHQVPTSVHGLLGKTSCTACHGDQHEIQSAAKVIPERCATCHEDAVKEYAAGVHADARKTGNTDAPNCLSCHGGVHQILSASDAKSPVNHLNVPKTCATCHDQKLVMEKTGHSTQPYESYEQSVHGKAVASGSEKAAVCTDCHGVHEILSAANPKSSIFKFNVPTTCAKCHGPVEQQFVASIHGQAISRGNWQAPVCTDCHGIHTIKAPKDPNSSVSPQNVARVTCAKCHEGVQLSQEFGVPTGRVSSYMASYHGLAASLGSPTVANCASCHGVHNIFPSSDPRSTINQANLVQTCGQCHPGVTDKFVAAKVHVDAPLAADMGSKAVSWVRRIYVPMIILVIGGMVLHNLIIWRYKAVAKRNSHPRTVTRMSGNQRLQHILLFTSFIVLVITGFALKYPTSWFSGLLGLSEHLRGIIHRVAGVVLVAVSLYHLAYALLTRDGRRLLLDFLPKPKDATDVVGTMLHYLGLKRTKPEYARFTYAEKAEYWALVWGMFVMAGTGIMLWAKVFFGNLLPRWFLDIATAIHFYEAVLATLAIVVWHFYQVFLDPDAYPMNWAWWDGKMSVEHYREEHGLDAATLLDAAKREASERASADTVSGNAKDEEAETVASYK
ncbi:MAG TPA: cytochrome b/b6 domain-containing protein [Terriglobales bacterium]